MMRYFTVGTFVLALVVSASGFWIQAKAQLGQVLLESAWKKTLSLQSKQKPWPWADTWPVAKLTIPSMNQSLIVLEGVSGEAMAFGPGTINTAIDGVENNVMAIGGHRDSHMQFLEHIKTHSTVELQDESGSSNAYRVTKQWVADSATEKLVVPSNAALLVLITCYPFNALQTGGSLRYVVLAELISPTAQIN